jgi:hypothetical protein
METHKSSGDAATFSVEAAVRLHDAFRWHEHNERQSTLLTCALDAMCTEAHFRGMTPEGVVVAMKHTWEQATRPAGITTQEWTQSYYTAVGRCLSQYFGQQITEEPRPTAS